MDSQHWMKIFGKNLLWFFSVRFFFDSPLFTQYDGVNVWKQDEKRYSLLKNAEFGHFVNNMVFCSNSVYLILQNKKHFVLSKMWMNFNPCEHLLHPIPLKLTLKKQNLMASILTASLSNKTRLTIMEKVSYQMSPCVLVFPTMTFSRCYS